MLYTAENWPFEEKPAREVQIEALNAANQKPGFAYFMRMRLGKTLVAYAEFCKLREEGKVKWMFVISPNSVKQQWVNEIEGVNLLEQICVYESQKKKDVLHWFKHCEDEGGVFIINYESMAAFMKDEMWKRFNPDAFFPQDAFTWDFTKPEGYSTLANNFHDNTPDETGKLVFKFPDVFIVADESTKLKDFGAKMTKASLNFAVHCGYRRILTGKPTANSNADLWGQLKFIGATSRNYHQHRWMFCMMGGYQGRQVVRNINTERLREEINPYCYIAPDKYLKGFEKVYEPMRRVTLRGDQLTMYKEMQDALYFELTNDVAITAPIALVKYLRLQQISSGVAGDPNGVQHNLVNPSDNPRIREVINLLENEIDNKCLIVCRFRLSIDNLYGELTKKGYKCVKLIGGMKPMEIEDVKSQFNEGDYDIMIAQEQVLSFGHTLCASDKKPCDSVMFYESSFSLINRAQCEARPEKMGRDIPISYYDFYCSGMDKYILEALRKKEEGATALMGYARERGAANFNWSEE